MKVVITDYEYQNVETERKIVTDAGMTLEDYQVKDEEGLIEATRDADAVIVQYACITRAVIEKMRRCRAIIRYGIGINNIDINAAAERGIYVCNIPDYGIDEVSNHAVAGILALSRGLSVSNRALRQGLWAYTPVKPLRRFNQCAVGILGYGRMGSIVAHKLSSFGVRLLANDILPKQPLDAGVEIVDFDTLLRESDFLTLHCPLYEKTRHIINAQAFARMKRGAYLINTSRGAVVEETALINALNTGILAGAAIDVFEDEPIGADHPLLAMPQVIAMPHTAWYSEQSIEALQRKAALEAVNILQGNPPYHACKP